MQVKYFLTLSISVTNDKGKVSEISHCSLTTLKYLLNYIKAVVPLNCGVQKSHFLPLLLAYYYSCHTTQSNGPRERKNRARSRKRKKVNSTGRVIARCEHGLIINWIGCYTSFILFFFPHKEFILTISWFSFAGAPSMVCKWKNLFKQHERYKRPGKVCNSYLNHFTVIRVRNFHKKI